MVDHERPRHLHRSRHIEKTAARRQRGVERGEFLRAEVDRLGHEVLPEKIGVLKNGLLERAKDDPALPQLFRQGSPVTELVVDEGQLGRRHVRRSDRSQDGRPRRRPTLRQFDSRHRAEAPELVRALGQRQGAKAVPRRALEVQPPFRQVAEPGEMGGEDLGREGTGGSRGNRFWDR